MAKVPQVPQVFNKKVRTVTYNEPLGLQVECRRVSTKPDCHELQVDYCVASGQVRGVQDMVITHVNGKKIWDDKGSFSVQQFTTMLKTIKRKKEDFKVTFHDKGFIKSELQKTKAKAAKMKKNDAEKKVKEKAKKKEKKDAAQKKAKAAAESKTTSKSKSNGRVVSTKSSVKGKSISTRTKVPHKTVMITPSREVGLQIELNGDNHVHILKCHKGSQAAGTKGYVMFKIESFHVYQSLSAVQNLLKKLMQQKKSFKITFVKPEHMENFKAWESQQAPGAASSSLPLPSASKGKRKAATAFVEETKLERDFKKLKAENSNLKIQIKSLRSLNSSLQKQVDASDNGMAV